MSWSVVSCVPKSINYSNANSWCFSVRFLQYWGIYVYRTNITRKSPHIHLNTTSKSFYLCKMHGIYYYVIILRLFCNNAIPLLCPTLIIDNIGAHICFSFERGSMVYSTLQWRHNDRDGVSNHCVSIVCSTVCSGADRKKNIKAPRQWPLWGEFNSHLWIPLTKGQ